MKSCVRLVVGLFAVLAIGSASLAATSTSTSAGTGNVGSTGADFPPGMFTDGGHYSVNDFKGKVVVLYFGCPVCPSNRGSIPGRNKIVEEFKNEPVKFLAITPAPMTEAKEYATETKLEMPCFADGLGVMQQRYGTAISLQNIWQVRVINPQGKVVGYEMTADAIKSAIAKVKWKYKGDGYDARLSNIVDLLEWNQYAPAMQMLRPFLKQKTKTGDSARALYEKVKSTEGTRWASEAEAALADDTVKAFDLDSRLATFFPDDEIGKHAADELKQLRKDKAVTAELAARQMYVQLYGVMSKAMPNQKPAVVNYCLTISQRYPDSPTGKTAAQIAQELQTTKVAE